MKKNISLLTAAAILLSLTGCSQSSNVTDTVNSAGAPAATAGVAYPSLAEAPEGWDGDVSAAGSDYVAIAEEGEYKATDIGGTGSSDDSYSAEEGMAAFADSVAYSADGEAAVMPGEDYGEDCDGDYIIIDEPDEDYVEPAAGLLTGGEWRDNDHWSDWDALYSSRSDWGQYKSDWRISYDSRITVKVTSDGKPLKGAKVTCPNATSAVTDNKGVAYLFYQSINGATEPITITCGDVSETVDGVIGNAVIEHEMSGASSATADKLDLMIMCDTTGSMADELSFLQEELKDIVTRVQSDNANIPTRVSVNFYRDEGDEYIVREYPFTTDISAASNAIGEQSADGGGDFPEAVHTALDSAINGHDWDEDAVKILFLVLDAPPHDDVQIIDSVNSLIAEAAEQGIRIIPIASSGIDKSTEYLLRTMAFTTGGTYTFLTDDSGIGGEHIEPTVGAYNVEKLNDMMVRIVNEYLE